MKIAHRFASTVVLFSALATAHAQTLTELEAQWRAINATPPPQKFEPLIHELLAYRDQAGGKNWQLNYMLGSSYCHTAGQEQKGKIALYRVLGGYGLPDAARSAAQQVLSTCGKQATGESVPSFALVPVSGQVGAIVHGKSGFEVSTSGDLTSGILQVSPVPVAELQKRIFSSDHSAEALAAALARGENPKAKGAVVGSFVIISWSGPSPQDIGTCLTTYRHPLESQFKMQLPASLITVYAVSSEQVPDYAAKLHGVTLPLGTVAYSVYEDLSIVGIGEYEACGSLAHELVHLSIRQNFGDCPAWLEEGLASEVAVATPQPDTYRFDESWRDEELRARWTLRPSVSQLLSKTWSDYSVPELPSSTPHLPNQPSAYDGMSQVHRVAALHAMAAAFIRYLDAKHKLMPVYFAMRDSMSSPTPRSDKDILEAELGMNLDRIDADFVQWFGQPQSSSMVRDPWSMIRGPFGSTPLRMFSLDRRAFEL